MKIGLKVLMIKSFWLFFITLFIACLCVGDMEIPFGEFGNTEIPFHRIRYYKKNDEVIWDRRKKSDKLFAY